VSSYIQYFNVEKMGRLPNGADALLTRRMGVYTKLASVQDARGGTVYVLTGLGKPKRYFLWEAFTIEDVTFDGEQYTVSGRGWVLLPPQPLQGKAFEQFKGACANFVSFRCIDDQGYRDTLRKLAEKYRREDVDAACEAFCDDLIAMLPKSGDPYYYRATVRQRLAKADAAREDFRKAVEVGTNFRHEAELALRGSAPASAAAGRMAEQVVARGRFARQAEPPAKGERKPFDMPESDWGAIRSRRGPEEFRARLLEAYGGRCAVTGCDCEAALEAAFIVGNAETGPQDVGNGLLLRSDVHTLFDLNLVRIHPRTRKIFLSDALKRGAYAKLVARQLRLPEKAEDRPSAAALQQRWEAAGGPGT
jgi:hypothetical protein